MYKYIHISKKISVVKLISKIYGQPITAHWSEREKERERRDAKTCSSFRTFLTVYARARESRHKRRRRNSSSYVVLIPAFSLTSLLLRQPRENVSRIACIVKRGVSLTRCSIHHPLTFRIMKTVNIEKEMRLIPFMRKGMISLCATFTQTYMVKDFR